VPSSDEEFPGIVTLHAQLPSIAHYVENIKHQGNQECHQGALALFFPYLKRRKHFFGFKFQVSSL
jgi:hypothetical protein